MLRRQGLLPSLHGVRPGRWRTPGPFPSPPSLTAPRCVAGAQVRANVEDTPLRGLNSGPVRVDGDSRSDSILPLKLRAEEAQALAWMTIRATKRCNSLHSRRSQPARRAEPAASRRRQTTGRGRQAPRSSRPGWLLESAGPNRLPPPPCQTQDDRAIVT
jgi:hypothetical protein